MLKKIAGGLAILALAAGCANQNPVSPAAKSALVPLQTLVDDFEGASVPQDALGGYWFVFADTNGTSTSPSLNGTIAYSVPGSPLTPGHCFRFVGVFGTPATTATAIFAGMGCTLNSNNVPLDLSGFTGVQFMCRSGIRTQGSFIINKKSVTQTNADFQAAFAAPTDWTLIRVPFSSLRQPATVQPVPLTVTDVVSLQWVPSKAQKAFDFEIDDINFY